MAPLSEPAIGPEATLHNAVRCIEESHRGIAVVIDEHRRILGTLTDGDIRRAILRGRELDSPAAFSMNSDPLTALAGTSDANLVALLAERRVEAIPLVNAGGAFVRIVHLRDLVLEAKDRGGAEGFAAAVIMAGGEGLRLRPLTKTIPKAMVEVGSMPIIERHVRHLSRAGIRRVFLSVNYLAHLIEEHFAAITDLDVQIDYLREDVKMGTVGSLTLLPELKNGPVLLFNTDVLHAADYANLLSYHQGHAAAITIAAVEHLVQIPYGVIRTEEGMMTELQEKPSQRFLCNAGIYVIAQEALARLPRGKSTDMPEFLEKFRGEGRNVAVFPLHEYWADIADAEDLARVRTEIENLEHLHG